MKKKAMLFLIVLLVLSAAAAAGVSAQSGGEGQKTAFVSGFQQLMPDISGTRIKIVKGYSGIQPADQKTVAVAHPYIFTGDYSGHYLAATVNRVSENKVVHGQDQYSGEITFELPGVLSADIDMYWVGGDRIFFDKEKDIVMTLAATAAGDLKVTAYAVSGFALKDMTYLGAYRENQQTKLMVSDGVKVYIVDLETMSNERGYDLQGFKPIGANLGLPLDKSDSRLGVWLASRDNRAMYNMELPTGEIRMEADLAQYDVNGEIVKLVSGWSGYIAGGYGGVLLVKDNQGYMLYDSRFKRMVDRYPYSGKPLGDVKDIHWAILHGVRTRAVIVVVEKDGGYLREGIIEAREFYEKPAIGAAN